MNKLSTSLSFNEYQGLEGINWSVVKNMDEPATARHMMDSKPKQTDPMLLGSLVDALVTTPTLVESLFIEQPEGKEYDYRTNDGKEWRDNKIKAGITPVKQTIWNAAKKMADSVLSHPEASDLLKFEFGHPQTAIQWEDRHGSQCRGLVDFLIRGGGWVELKTTSADSWDKFSRDCHFRKYHGQLAYSRRGLRACGRESKDVRMIVVRNVEPYVVEVFQPSYMFLDTGDELVNSMLDIWNIYKDRPGDWKEYNHETPVLDLPMWAYGT